MFREAYRLSMGVKVKNLHLVPLFPGQSFVYNGPKPIVLDMDSSRKLAKPM